MSEIKNLGRDPGKPTTDLKCEAWYSQASLAKLHLISFKLIGISIHNYPFLVTSNWRLVTSNWRAVIQYVSSMCFTLRKSSMLFLNNGLSLAVPICNLSALVLVSSFLVRGRGRAGKRGIVISSALRIFNSVQQLA